MPVLLLLYLQLIKYSMKGTDWCVFLLFYYIFRLFYRLISDFGASVLLSPSTVK